MGDRLNKPAMSSTITSFTSSTSSLQTLGLILIVTLILLLIQNEVISTTATPWAQKMRRALGFAIAPLSIAFLLIAISHLFAILS